MISLILCSMASVMAQNTRKVTGTVVDDLGEPLPNAAVRVKGNDHIGAATDINGKFTLEIPANTKMLYVTFVGMKNKEVKPVFGKAMRILMEEDSKMVEDVLVLGYGSARKKGSVTGSVATIGAKTIENMPSANFTDALQGQVAGLAVSSSSGEPGATATMRIRGENSINTDTSPLYILDGTPISADVFNSLNPNDIVDLAVLKDASSTAIYGSRAANGVILITSRKGKFDQKPIAKISMQYGFGNIINSGTKMMNAQQYMQYREKLDPTLLTNAEWLSHKKVVTNNGIDTDWVKETYRQNAPTYQLNASVSGGTENTNYYLSINHFNKEGIEPLSKAQRSGLRLSTDVRITPIFKVGADINMSYNLTVTNPEQGLSDATLVNPTVFSRLARPDDAPYYYTVNPDGTINKGAKAEYLHYTQNMAYTPALLGEYRQKGDHAIHLNGNLYEELTPIKGLTIRTIQALTGYDDNYSSLTYPFKSYVSPMGDLVDFYADFKTTPSRRETSQRFYQFTSSNTAEYKFDIKNKHFISVLIGEETIYSKSQEFSGYREGLDDMRMMLLQNSIVEPQVSQGFSETIYNSLFGQVSYNFADKYNIDASMRTDGSSRFPKKHRWATFWSAGARWNTMKEKFMLPLTGWLNQMDIKASYGTTGNSAFGDYNYFGTASSSNLSYNKIGGLLITGQSINDLTWETVKQLNVGIDFRFFKRLSAQIEYYDKRTVDMLMQIPSSYTTGYSEVWGNIGSMTNKGVDVNLTFDIFNRKNLYWDVHANFNYNKNKITELFNGLDEYVLSGRMLKYQVGKSYSEYFMVKRAGVDPRDGKQMWYDLDGNLTKTYSESNAQFIGKNQYAPFNGGFGTNFNWKGFSVSVDFTWALGKYTINNDRYFYENSQFGQSFNQSASMMNMWTTPGQITDIPASTEQIYIDDHLLENASYMRLKKLSIGYNLPEAWIKPLKVISKVNLYATARNLFTFTKYTGYDPEPERNFIQFNYPNTREFLFGLEVTF